MINIINKCSGCKNSKICKYVEDYTYLTDFIDYKFKEEFKEDLINEIVYIATECRMFSRTTNEILKKELQND